MAKKYLSDKINSVEFIVNILKDYTLNMKETDITNYKEAVIKTVMNKINVFHFGNNLNLYPSTSKIDKIFLFGKCFRLNKSNRPLISEFFRSV